MLILWPNETPFVVIRCIPEVALNDVVCDEEVTVIPEDIVKSPYIILLVPLTDPENPVKSTDLKLPFNTTASELAVIFILTTLDSIAPDTDPKSTDRPAPPGEVRFTVGVPVYAKLSAEPIDTTVPVVPLTSILPVPNTTVLALTALDKNDPQVRTLLFRVSVPRVKFTAVATEKFNPRLRLNVLDEWEMPTHAAPDATTTIPEPDSESINTVSAVVGTDAPPAPPEVVDQFVVFDPSQVPDPPTQ